MYNVKYVIVKAVARFGSIFNHKRAREFTVTRGEKATGKWPKPAKPQWAKGRQAARQDSLKIDAQMTVTILFNWF